jgi:hypothetical protein
MPARTRRPGRLTRSRIDKRDGCPGRTSVARAPVSVFFDPMRSHPVSCRTLLTVTDFGGWRERWGFRIHCDPAPVPSLAKGGSRGGRRPRRGMTPGRPPRPPLGKGGHSRGTIPPKSVTVRNFVCSSGGQCPPLSRGAREFGGQCPPEQRQGIKAIGYHTGSPGSRPFVGSAVRTDLLGDEGDGSAQRTLQGGTVAFRGLGRVACSRAA